MPRLHVPAAFTGAIGLRFKANLKTIETLVQALLHPRIHGHPPEEVCSFKRTLSAIALFPG
jgi:hypothetical protein